MSDFTDEYTKLFVWQSEVDQNRSFAVVPVKLFRKNEKKKKLIPVAIYYTAADGKFYFVTPDDGGDYALGPSVSQAQKMPDKVKQFFRELEEKGLEQKEMIH